MKEILIATTNQHKIDEYRKMLEPYGYFIKSLNDYPPLEIVEDGNSFAENALIKARALAALTKVRVIADDSGLEIKALDNRPGIYSARYLGVDTPYQKKNQLILEKLKDVKDRQARFVCAIALVEQGEEKVFMGTFNGSIAYEAKGENGFGYDPIFYVDDHHMTAAELAPELKNRISHRGQALKQVLPYLLTRDDHHE